MDPLDISNMIIKYKIIVIAIIAIIEVNFSIVYIHHKENFKENLV